MSISSSRVRRAHRAIGGLAAAVVVTLPASAPAHEISTPEVGPAEAAAALGRHVAPLADGTFLVRPKVGPPLVSHGPDPISDYLPSRRAVAIGERAPACAADYRHQVLVGHLAGTPDPLADLADDARASVRRVNAMLNEESLVSGGPNADLKVACDPTGQINVGSFASPSPLFEDVVAAARAAGYARPGANYTIYFNGHAIGGWCGMASFVADEKLATENRNNGGGAYGVIYRPCWEGLAPLHEIAHNQGAVQAGAPNSTGSGGHCNQLLDVVCFAPDGGDRNQVATLACASEPRFDCGFDDYFDSAPEPGEYLDGHWNLGSHLNRFIEFGREAPTDYLPSAGCAEAVCASPLRLGLPVTGTLGADPPGALYRLRMPRRAAAFRIKLDAPEGAEIRVRPRRPPGLRSPVCGTSSCRVRSPRRGKWYVLVSGPGGGGEFELTAAAR